MPEWTSKVAILTLGGPTRTALTAVLVGHIPLRIERRSSAIILGKYPSRSLDHERPDIAVAAHSSS